MHSFTQSFLTSEGMMTFTFNRHTTIQGVICFVNFSDAKSAHHTFRMLKGREKTWTIIDKTICPDWLIAYEKELEQVILEH